MSIETDLNRIATGIEEIIKIMKSNSTATPVIHAAVKTVGRPPKTTASPAADGPAVTAAAEANQAEITQDQIHAALQVYMEKNGVDGPTGVKSIMIKHGANKVKPTITSIPPASYAALLKEITA